MPFFPFRIPLPKLEHVGQWKVSSDGNRRKTGLMSLPVKTKNLAIKVIMTGKKINR